PDGAAGPRQGPAGSAPHHRRRVPGDQGQDHRGAVGLPPNALLGASTSKRGGSLMRWFLGAALAMAAGAAAAQPMVIEHVTVVPMTPGAPEAADRTVVIDKGRIVS